MLRLGQPWPLSQDGAGLLGMPLVPFLEALAVTQGWGLPLTAAELAHFGHQLLSVPLSSGLSPGGVSLSPSLAGSSPCCTEMFC